MIKDLNLLVGTYTRQKQSDGIYQVRDDLVAHCVAKTDNPSYLAAHPNGDVVYCVNEIDDYANHRQPADGIDPTDITPVSDKNGSVSAFFVSAQTDNGTNPLTLMNQQASLGADPCHIVLDTNGSFLIVSNYSGGTFASIELDDEGYLNEFISLTQHSGHGPNKNRQESAHVHSSLIGEACVYVADLGADRVVEYPVSARGEIGIEGQKNIPCTPGSGPRFMAATKQKLWVLNELNNTLVSYQISDLSEIQTISTVPNADTPSIAAHLTLSTDAQFAYVSNRGFDTIAVFALEPKMKLIQTIATGGQHPRHFILTPDEKTLLVANQESNNIVVFQRDPKTGLLEALNLEINVPCPVCLLTI